MFALCKPAVRLIKTLLHMLPYQIKNTCIESLSYKKNTLNYLFILIIRVDYMLNAFTSYEIFCNKNIASYGVMCVTFIKITF